MMEDKSKILMEFIVQDIIKFLVEDKKIEFDEAMKIFVATELFDKLHDTETGLYRESSAYIYDLLKIELEYGYLKQLEY